MGCTKMSQIWLLSWLLILTGLQSTQQSDMMATTMIPGSAHNRQVCSTWGNFHYSTFDGEFFQLPYACNYILTTMCDSTRSDFNIQMRREYIGGVAAIRSFNVKLEGTVIMLHEGNITMDNEVLTIPGYYNGIRVEKVTNYIKISSKLGVTVFWDEDNSLSIELSKDYMNQTCGLCGDFNGIMQNEFIENGQHLPPEEFALKWKMDAPTETCQQKQVNSPELCQEQRGLCQELLSHPSFKSCYNLLPTYVYFKACVKDLCQCNSSQHVCLCDTISEFSRQCAHAGGKPGNWRSDELCGKTCPSSMVHSECGNPCTDTCSNQEGSQICADHCVDGCVCPPGTVLDDIAQTGCISVDECACTHNGETYQPGKSFQRTCQECVCSKGRWNCISLDCPGTCSLLGGSHITTYDRKAYSFQGNCDYILSKDNSSDVSVLVHLARCGLAEGGTCLTSVKIIISSYSVTITATGTVLVNNVENKLPIFTDQVKIFKPSTFFIIVQTPSLNTVIQLVTVMQVYVEASTQQKGTLSGLCGNFNDMQADDFKTESGLTEGTATTFASTWKTTICQDSGPTLYDPCSMSVEKENYAKEWCEKLSNPAGVFSPCNLELNPKDYVARCKYDACICDQSEECMCAAVSSYVYACAARGVMLKNWRANMCSTYTTKCPGNMEYSYNQTSCRKTCRSLSENDRTCHLSHTPVDGCGCAKNTYLNDMNECVPASECPCYVDSEVMAPLQVISMAGSTCTCRDGKMHCIGHQEITTCTAPLVYFNCSDTEPGQKGTECQNSCHTPDSNQCTNTQCKSGCVCPEGLLADGQGGCVQEENCPCIHNGVFYQTGEIVKADCNNCTCKNRKWICTEKECSRICTIYGDSHYISFDGRRFTFSGNCEYTLAQDYCGNSNSGTFRIITENIPCGTTGTTCSKAIKIYLGDKQLLLSEENIKSLNHDNGTEIPYKIHSVGIYLVIEAENSLALFWDKKTSLMVKLSPSFKGKVCGLCGNYDGNWNNDFMTRGGEEVTQATEFGNSWKVSATCPEASNIHNPCDMRPYRQAWAIKQCSILKSDVFSKCHSVVDPTQYYDACVRDTCACDAGGDCECFCTAVAAYASACSGQGVCIMWRTPTICPLFCDYYNRDEGCEWHYKPCGKSCMKTCRNPTGACYSEIPPLEGCFPQCPSDRPYLEEATNKCVAREECGCYDDETNTYYSVGDRIPTTQNCMKCYCTAQGRSCQYSQTDCSCEYNGQKYETGKIIYHTTDGDGACLTAICGQNGTIVRNLSHCPTETAPTTPVTIFNFTSSITTVIPPTITETMSPTIIPTITVSSVIPPTTTTGTVSTTIMETSSMTTEPPFPTTPPPSPPTTITTVIPPTPTGTVSTTIVETSSMTTEPPATSTPPPPSPPTSSTTLITVIPPSTTSIITETTITSPSAPTTTSCQPCQWSKWLNNDYPLSTPNGKDIESIPTLWKSGLISCEKPVEIECRASQYKDKSLLTLGQKVTCDITVGLICDDKEQNGEHCFDYEIRVKCCDNDCTQATTAPTTKVSSTTPASTIITTVIPPITTETVSTTIMETSSMTTEPPVHSTTTLNPTTTVILSTTPPSTETTYSVITKPTGTAAPQHNATTPSTTVTTVIPPTTPGTVSTTIVETSSMTTKLPVPSTTTPPPSTTATTVIPPTTTETVSTTIMETSSMTTEPPATSTPPPPPTSSTTLITVIPPSTTSIRTETTITSPSAPTTTSCQPCQWSKWLNNDYPLSTPNGKDIESIPTLWKSGLISCEKPVDIECRASQYKDMPLSTLGQKVTCDITVGLICDDKEQNGEHCYDYEIRVKCCDNDCTQATTAPTTNVSSTTPASTIITTVIPPITTETVSTTILETSSTTTVSPVPTTPIPSTTVTTEIPPTTTETVSTTTGETSSTTTVSPVPTTPIPPTSSTTITTVIPPTTTGTVSTTIVETSSMTTEPPATSAPPPPPPTSSTTSTTVIPPTSTGTVSTAIVETSSMTTEPPATSTPPPPTSSTMSTTVIPPTPTGTVSTTIVETSSMTTEPPATSTPPPPPTSSTTLTTVIPPSTTSIITEITITSPSAPTTTSCQPCQWSKWLNNDYPLSTPNGKDIESIPTLWKSGLISCEKPVDIECRASQYKDKPLSTLGQKVTCNITVGLICDDKEQNGEHCYDYEIRVKCCDNDCTQATTAPTTKVSSTTPASTIITTVIPPITTETVSTTIMETSSMTTEPPVHSTTTLNPTTTVILSTTPPSTETTYSVITKPTGTAAPQHNATTPSTTVTTVIPPTTPGTVSTTIVETSSMTTKLPVPSTTTPPPSTTATTVIPPTTTETVSTTIMETSSMTTEPPATSTPPPPPTSSTTLITVIPPSTTSIRTETTITSPSAPTTTSCQPCQWSKWLNNDYPLSTPNGKDIESIPTLWKSGLISCEKPVDIECRASQYKDMPLSTLGQKVTCDITVGLICDDKEQNGEHCYDYEIRVKCCDNDCTQATTAPTTNVSSTTPASTIITTVIPPITTETVSTTILETSSTTTVSPVPTTPIPSTTVTTEIPPTTTETVSTTTGETSSTTTVSPVPTTPIPPTSSTTITTVIPPTTTGTVSTTIVETSSMTTEPPATSAPPPPPPTSSTTSTTVIPPTSTGTVSTAIVETSSMTTEPPATSTPPPPTSSTMSTTVIPPTPTGTVSTTVVETSSMTTEPPATSTPPPPPTSSTTLTTVIPPSTTSIITEITITSPSAPTTTSCQPCQWSKWLNNDYPLSTPNGKDIESIPTLWKSGLISCEKPVDIECRASQYKDKPLSTLGQKVTCNITVGLICDDKEQNGEHCYDYEIRVKCCDNDCTQATTAPTTKVSSTTPASTIITTVIPPITTETVSTTIMETSSMTTEPPVHSTTTLNPTTTVILSTTPPSTETTYSVITKPTGTAAPQHNATTPSTTVTTVIPPTTPGTVSTTIVETSSMTTKLPVPSTTTPPPSTTATTVIPPTTTETVSTTIMETSSMTTEPPATSTPPPPPTSSTTLITVIPPSTTSIRTETTITSPSAPTTTSCQPCQWSKWLNNDYPLSTPNGKDIESIPTLWKSGLISCEKPVDIECRASQYKDMPLSTLDQKVTCDITVGLICDDKEQNGEHCYDYEIRVKCCDNDCTQATTAPTTNVSSTTPASTIITTVIPPITTETVSTTILETSSTTTVSPVPTTPIPSTTVTTEIPPTTTETVSTTTGETSSTTTVSPVPTTPIPPTSSTTITTVIPPTTTGTVSTTIVETSSMTTEPPATSAPPPPPPTSSTTSTTVIPPTSTGTVSTAIVETSSMTTEPPATSTPPPPTSSTMSTTVIPPTPTGTVSTTIVETSSMTTEPPATSTPPPPPTSSTTLTTVIPPSTTSIITEITITSPSAPTTTSCQPCQWSKWLNNDYPLSTPNGKDIESIPTLWKSGLISCEKPVEIECRASQYKDKPLSTLGQKVTCDITVGLICDDKEQNGEHCYDYEIRVKCCDNDCTQGTTAPTTKVSSTTPASTIITTVIPPTTTETVSTTTVETSSTTTVSPVPTTPIPPTSSITITTVIPPTTIGTVSTTIVETSSMTTEPPLPTSPILSPTVTTVIPPTTIGTVSTTIMETSSMTTEPPVPSTTTPNPSTAVTTVIPPTPTGTVSTTIMETSSMTTEPPASSTAPHPATTVTTVIPLTTTETVFTTIKKTSGMTTERPVFSTSPPNPTFSVITKSIVTAAPQQSTTVCVCTYMEKTFYPGSVMYNQTDEAGWCFIAICESGCNVFKKSEPCVFTTPTPYTPSASTTTSTPLQKGCKFLDPPRKNGETWRNKCFEETCQNGSVISTPLQCLKSDPTVPVCENNIPPVKVYDETGCCYHYECQCRCTGWGDPHYVSFDGTYYAFQGNCTYVLVQEIIKKYNFSVHIKNYMCDIEQALACPEYLTVYYKSYQIELKQTRNPTVNTVYVNNKKVTPVYTNADFTITTTGIAMTLDIPAIQAQVIFKGMNFLVSLPFSRFHNNTEGQCGNCDNNRSNDCRLPNGKVIQSCEEMAPKWQVNKTVCPTPQPPPKTTVKPCQPAICKIIFSKAFEQCHKVIDPENFYKACVYDVCNMKNATGCFSLEGYAQMCAEESVCVDWRNLTNGQCPHDCPKHKVYLPCGPKTEKSCNSGYNEMFINCESRVCRDHFREGCYCPNGTTLLDTTSDVCTKFCGCIGSDGQPKQPGDKWRSECKECTCSKNSMGPLCEPVQCPNPEPCTKAGYELEIVDCCPKCVCKPRLCPTHMIKCPVGFEIVQNRTDNDCCITFYCEPKNVCVFHENVYLPGEKVPTGSCEDCVCGLTVNSSSKLLKTECTPMACNTTCPMGFSYQAVPGKCCGNCVQKQCVYEDPDQSNRITTAEVGQNWTHPRKPCVTFNCTKVNNVFVLVKIPPSCPEYNPQDCVPGTEKMTSDGCCKTCQLHQFFCNLQKNITYLKVNDCTSIQPVEIASCSGSCDTKSIYSMAANTMTHHCTCCKELRTSSKQVQLRCAKNTLKPYTYTYVEECGCHVTNCTD
ncbi:mucin-2-like isoform X2 [Hemibagrus wyckioides]|uniref:mucin-2-like isoform X2 n=1 Tax=Hemibagrus wyckioides TaxID=337641 RepID=UPI00266C73C1|nr:mucin-2-like isoform X2 [Hemibagrus wyckioides]